MLMTTKIGRMVTYLKRVSNQRVIKHFDYVVLQGQVQNENYYTSITRVFMVTKLGRMITYLDELLPIKLHYRLITWSCKIT